jgi:hypothetical protein
MTLLLSLLFAAKLHCGTERWAVKTTGDSTAASIVTTPDDTTIEFLVGIQPVVDVHSPAFAAARIGPVERTVFRVPATITFFKHEADRDIHVVLSDDAGHTMIAELPDSRCLPKSSPFYQQIVGARTAFESHFATGKQHHVPASAKPETKVVVTGIGFFDFIHGQTGVAPNGIELHPVLSIQFLP